jgi:APA family basic amino acid/polyamine antiporter
VADAPHLRRSLSLWQVTVSGVGIVIGAGIYVLIGVAARDAGAGLWVSFLLAALLAGLTGLSYAELAGMFPAAGAEFEFARRAFGSFAGFVAGWAMIAGNVVAAAAVAVGFAHYFREYVPLPTGLIAVGLLTVLTGIVMSGVQRSIWLSTLLVAFQIGGLVIVIAAGTPHIGDHALLEGATLGGVLSGTALVFFAFIGFDEVVTLSEETRDPARVIPRALLLALAISTALYVAVGVTAVSLVGAEALAGSDRPLALVLEHDLGWVAGAVVSFIAMAATTNTSLLVLTAASRLAYAMAREGELPEVFATLSGRHAVPRAAAVAALVVAAPFALTGQIGLVASATDFLVYAIFLVVNGAVIALRFRAPEVTRPFRTPWAVGRMPVLPVLGVLAVVLMLAYLDREAAGIGAAILGAGVFAWVVLRLVRRR